MGKLFSVYDAEYNEMRYSLIGFVWQLNMVKMKCLEIYEKERKEGCGVGGRKWLHGGKSCSHCWGSWGVG